MSHGTFEATRATDFGTTIITEEMTGCVYHSIEISSAYADVVCQQDFTGNIDTIEATGDAFHGG